MFYDFSDIFVTFDWLWTLDFAINFHVLAGLQGSLDNFVDWFTYSLNFQLLLFAILDLSLWDLDDSLNFIAFFLVLRNLNIFDSLYTFRVLTSNLGTHLDRLARAWNWDFNRLCVRFHTNFSCNRSWDINVDRAASLTSLFFMFLLEDILSTFGLMHVSLDYLDLADLFLLTNLICDLLNLNDLGLVARNLDCLGHWVDDLFVARLLVSHCDDVRLWTWHANF